MSAPTIVCPITFSDAIELAEAAVGHAHGSATCDACLNVRVLVQAVDVASREQAWADRGGPELLAALESISDCCSCRDLHDEGDAGCARNIARTALAKAGR